MSTNTNTKEGKTIFFDAVLVSCYKKTQKSDEGKISKNKLNLTTTDKDLWEQLDTLYESTPKKFIPAWYKGRDDKNMVSLKSQYDIPVKIDSTGETMSFDAFCERGKIRGAKIKVKCNIKDFSIYPSAFVVFEDGEEYDAFEGF